VVAITPIPTSLLNPHPRNPRRDYPAEEMAQLMRSVQELGILEPLVVTPADGRYVIICGHRRWRAAKMAKMPTVPCLIRDDLDELGQLATIAAENLARESLLPTEEARLFQSMLAQGMSIPKIASVSSRAWSFVVDRMALLRLPDDLQRHVDERRLPLQAAVALSNLESEEQMRAMARNVIEGAMTSKETKAMVRLAKRRVAQQAPATAASHALTANGIRLAARATCAACALAETTQRAPRWEEVEQAKGLVCAECECQGFADICHDCPLTQFLRFLAQVGGAG
jgi:ParB family chromosome partitioning protein